MNKRIAPHRMNWKWSQIYIVIIVSILMTVSFSGCLKDQIYLKNEEIDITSNETDIEDLKKDCIAAAIRGIELEIVKHQKWIDLRKIGEVDNENLPEMEERLKILKADREKYKKMELDLYEIPEKRIVKAWIGANEPLGDGSILYVENISESGPWYHIVGIRGNDYEVIQPDTKYSMSIYLVYPIYYWTMPSHYVYIFEYE